MTRRFDVAALLERATPAEGGISAVALSLGVSRSAIYKALREGLHPDAADRWAVRAGFHPCEVWPEWLEAS